MTALVLASFVFPSGIVGLLFKIAIFCVIIWAIIALIKWSQFPIPAESSHPRGGRMNSAHPASDSLNAVPVLAEPEPQSENKPKQITEIIMAAGRKQVYAVRETPEQILAIVGAGVQSKPKSHV
jgi:hypothetical protein